MTKFKYPADGLYLPNKSNLDLATNTISYLIRISNISSNSVPSSFPYRKYIFTLDDKYNALKKELDIIERLIKRDDTNMKELSEELVNQVKSLPKETINERERMIK
ncbi:MAG: hypothetical protein IKX00_04655 [Bacilli bacterium]|nr:hypothetical protein [Bacilli bacterium]